MMARIPQGLLSAPRADAGWRNMLLLVQLRWIAVFGQLITIAFVYFVMDIRLPILPLLVVPALLVIVNLVSIPVMRRRKHFSNSELTAALLLDVAALGWQLNHSGGLENPFAALFLLQVALGAMILKPASSWVVVATSLLVLGLLSITPEPLGLPPTYAHNPLRLYLIGSLVCFVLIAVLLVAFMTRISRNLR